MTSRRRVVLALGAGALAPLTSFAQPQTKVWRVGFLNLDAQPPDAKLGSYWFSRGLQELGYVEGTNVILEFRDAGGKQEQVPDIAAELVRLKVDVILANSGTAPAAQKATRTIPIVFANTFDPVAIGLVTSLSRPGGNVTGVSNALEETSAKSLEFLRALVPKLSRVAYLQQGVPMISNLFVTHAQAAAKAAGVNLLAYKTGTPEEVDAAFEAMAQAHAEALIVPPGPFLTRHASQVTSLAARNRLPVMYTHNRFMEEGGLMSYGPKLEEIYRQAARQVDKILKGAKPADIPVELPTEWELIINLKTAKALGIKIPRSILVRANQVIE